MNADPITSAQDPLIGILIRLSVEVTVLLIIISLIYRKFSGKREHMFSFFLMGIIIFALCAVLKSVEIQMGMALGLFAIFSIIRFRTSNFTTKEMSYLFTILGLSAINAMFDFPHPIRGTIIFNSILILTILSLEYSLKDNEEAVDMIEKKKGEKGKKEKSEKKKKNKKAGKKKSQNSHLVIYDNLKLLSRDKINELIRDLSKRTGLDIENVKINKIDLIKGNAELEVLCKEKVDKSSEDSN
jgi:hypothetical protein